MFDKNRLEGRQVAWNVVLNHAKVPLSEGTLEGFGQVGTHCPGGMKGRSSGCWFPFPPDDGVVDGLKGKGLVGLLDIGGQPTQGITKVKPPFLGSKHASGVKTGFGVGAQVVDKIPEVKTILESVGGQNGFDDRGSETMTCTTP